MDTIADRSSRFSEADVPGLDIPAEVTHVVFDWNGTLLHDASVIAMCDTEVGRRLGLWDREIDEALLREYSQRHWREGYEWLAGRALADAEVAQMDTVFHEAYVAFRHHAPLQPDALEVLADLDARGITFSLNSMHPHPLLMDILAERELTDRFVAIDGLRVQDTGSMSKTEHLYAHLGAVGVGGGDAGPRRPGPRAGRAGGRCGGRWLRGLEACVGGGGSGRGRTLAARGGGARGPQ